MTRLLVVRREQELARQQEANQRRVLIQRAQEQEREAYPGEIKLLSNLHKEFEKNKEKIKDIGQKGLKKKEKWAESDPYDSVQRLIRHRLGGKSDKEGAGTKFKLFLKRVKKHSNPINKSSAKAFLNSINRSDKPEDLFCKLVKAYVKLDTKDSIHIRILYCMKNLIENHGVNTSVLMNNPHQYFKKDLSDYAVTFCQSPSR